MSLVLYKYLPQKYAEPFLTRGEVLFRSVPYFLACEDARRDELEGVHQYAPVEGLTITNHTQGWTKRLPGRSFLSGIRNPEKIYIFCASRVLTPELALRFGTDTCVEIVDTQKFTARLKTCLRRKPSAALKTFMHAPVEYYRTDAPPKEVWALPERIIVNKPEVFSEEQEYRFVFSLRRDAFCFENVNLSLAANVASPPEGPHPEMLLKLGSMEDCCRIHRF